MAIDDGKEYRPANDMSEIGQMFKREPLRYVFNTATDTFMRDTWKNMIF